MRNLTIFDTTLRDGEQAPGNEMSPETKLALFRAIDSTGVDYVEAGFPTASPTDFEVVREIARTPRRARVCAFARAVPKDIDRALEALDSQANVQLELLLTGSEIHVHHKRRSTEEAILKETRDAVAYARSCGVEDIALGYEDATRGSREFLRRVVELGVQAGGTTIVLADTVGCSTPSEIASLVSATRAWVGDEPKISVHFHNDLGLALANTLAAIKSGADVAQTTFCGIGERAGNVALEELAAVLHYKAEEMGAVAHLDLGRVREVCDEVCAALGLTPWKHKPVIGRYAFSTAAGVHASGLANAPITYQYVDPELFGRRSETVLNRLSGRANLRIALGEIGLEADDALIERMYAAFIVDPNPNRCNARADFLELYRAAVGEPAAAAR
jgi:2-isopropylmalate synthase